jgi:hypothetical protein
MSLNEGRLSTNRWTFELYAEENCYPADGGSKCLRNVCNNLQTRRCMTLLEGVGVARCPCVTHRPVYTQEPQSKCSLPFSVNSYALTRQPLSAAKVNSYMTLHIY